MTRRVVLVIATFIAMIGFSGCVGASIMDKKVSSKKARVIFDVPNTVNLEKVTKGLYDAVNYRVSDLQENENLLPEELPEKAGSPKISQNFGRLSPFATRSSSLQMMQLDTSNAYYTVSGQGSSASSFNARAEYYKAAVYPYKNGYKIYFYLFYKEGTDGIMGALTKKVADSIIGEEGSLLYIAQIRDKFKELVPSAKIKSQSPKKLEKLILNGLGWAKSSDSE